MTYEIVCDDSDEERWRAERFDGISASTLAGFLGLLPLEWVAGKDELAAATTEALAAALREKYVQQKINDHADRIDAWERDLAEMEASMLDTEIQRAARLRASTEAGKRFEGAILEWAGELHGWKSWKQEHALVRRPDEPWFMATLDATVDDGLPGLALAEVKLCSVYVAKQWETDEPRVLDRRPKVPDYVLSQVYGQQFVTGAARTHVVVYWHGIEPRVVTVERDEKMIAAIVQEAREAWDRVLARRADALIALADEAVSL